MTSLPANLTPGTWNIDPAHSTVAFVARHLMISKVRGTFGSFSGTVTIADDLAASNVEATVDLTSVSTGDANRDTHLRSADFFNTESGTDMRFVSTGFSVAPSATSGAMHGELTIRGITKPVTLDVEFEGVAKDPWGNTKAAFTATGEISRKEWGIDFNAALEAGGVLIGDKVKLELDIQAVAA